ERLQGGTSIQVAAPALTVLQGQQYLCHRHFTAFQQFLVRVRQSDLPDSRRRLTLLEPQRTFGELQFPATQSDGSGRHQDDLLITLAQPQEILDQSLEPGSIDTSGFGINQQGRAHLHHNPAGLLQGRKRFGNLSAHSGENYTAIARSAARERRGEYAMSASGRIFRRPKRGRGPQDGVLRQCTRCPTRSQPLNLPPPKFGDFEEASGEQRLRTGSGPVVR